MKRTWAAILMLLMYATVGAQSSTDRDEVGKYYEINGAKIWTVTVGEGDPLFLIPGGPGNSHAYLRKFDALREDCKLVYFDGFGRGKSEQAADVRAYSLQRDVDDLEELRKAMGFRKINILGHSYGSIVAQAYAIRFPQHVKHLILSAPFHSSAMWQENDDNYNREIKTNYPEVWDTLMTIRSQGYTSSTPLHQAIYGRVPYEFLYAYNPETIVNQPRSTYPNNFNAALYYQLVGEDGDFKVTNDVGNFDFRKDLPQLSMPILVMAGRFDRVAVPWMMVKYKEYCPQAQLVMFEKSGHNTFLEEPAKTFEVIRGFLSE